MPYIDFRRNRKKTFSLKISNFTKIMTGTLSAPCHVLREMRTPSLFCVYFMLSCKALTWFSCSLTICVVCRAGVVFPFLHTSINWSIYVVSFSSVLWGEKEHLKAAAFYNGRFLLCNSRLCIAGCSVAHRVIRKGTTFKAAQWLTQRVSFALKKRELSLARCNINGDPVMDYIARRVLTMRLLS